MTALDLDAIRAPITGTLTVNASETSDRFEISAGEWDAMTPDQRAELLEEMSVNHMNNAGGYGYGLDDPDRDDEVGQSPSIHHLRAERDALAAELKQGTNDALALAAEENDRLAARVAELEKAARTVMIGRDQISDGMTKEILRLRAELAEARKGGDAWRASFGTSEAETHRLAVENHRLRAELAEASLVCVSCEHLWAQHGNWGCTADNDLGDCLCAVASSTTVLPAPAVAADTSREA